MSPYSFTEADVLRLVTEIEADIYADPSAWLIGRMIASVPANDRGAMVRIFVQKCLDREWFGLLASVIEELMAVSPAGSPLGIQFENVQGLFEAPVTDLRQLAIQLAEHL
jgi:hypothetical protein